MLYRLSAFHNLKHNSRLYNQRNDEAQNAVAFEERGVEHDCDRLELE